MTRRLYVPAFNVWALPDYLRAAILPGQWVRAGEGGPLGRTMTRTLDLTPTWAALVPAFVLVLTQGTQEGRDSIRAELARMAALADLWAAHVRAQDAAPVAPPVSPDADELARLRTGIAAALAALTSPHYGELENLADHAADARAVLESLTQPATLTKGL